MEQPHGEGISMLLSTAGKHHLWSNLAGTVGTLREATVLN